MTHIPMQGMRFTTDQKDIYVSVLVQKQEGTIALPQYGCRKRAVRAGATETIEGHLLWQPYINRENIGVEGIIIRQFLLRLILNRKK